jgi:hypothetical protein
MENNVDHWFVRNDNEDWYKKLSPEKKKKFDDAVFNELCPLIEQGFKAMKRELNHEKF